MFDKIVDDMKNRLVTRKEFNGIINKFLEEKFQGLVFLEYILIDKDKKQYSHGKKGEGECTTSGSYNLEGGYSVRICIWQKNEELKIDECKKLFMAYWNSECCDSVCGIPATDREQFLKKCDSTLKLWKNERRNIALLMLDLDNFKDVNTKYDHKIGTKVISEFSRIIFKAMDGKGILIHQSGDEFNILYSYEHYGEILELVYPIYTAVKEHKFTVAPDVHLTMAIGIWLVDGSEEENFEGIRTKAENTYDLKGKNQGKQRNSIRIGKTENTPIYGSESVKIGLIRVLSNIHNNRLFHNIYLDFIVQYISCIKSYLDISQKLQEFLKWVNPQFQENMRITKVSEKWDTMENISNLEIGLAVLQGVLKNANLNGKKIQFNVKQKVMSVLVEDKLLFQEKIGTIEEEVEWSTIKLSDISRKKDVRKIVLVQAGYSNMNELPEDIFYKTVRVDARPFIGGGLPDFWAATLAALITSMKKNPNFSNIVIYGDVQKIERVKGFLDSISEWDDEKIKYISKKTFKSYGDILAFRNKFVEHVSTQIQASELLEYVFSIYQDIQWDNSEDLMQQEHEKRFMLRELSYDEIKLEMTDGCRTDTIAKAFPIVLEILRNSQGKTIIDQAGRELVELTDFKIFLKTPKVDMLPGYYFYDEEELEQYYKNILIEKSGLFRKRLDKDNQLEEMIRHVVSAINGEHMYATRRAILVVQNEVQKGRNYSPLGLVEIWLAPRLWGKKVIIDYSYVWRTVEALVGMPLSMYASVKFAEEITQRIIEKIDDEKYVIEMGTLTYIANSLHMFTDEESMGIVRGIINEVSI